MKKITAPCPALKFLHMYKTVKSVDYPSCCSLPKKGGQQAAINVYGHLSRKDARCWPVLALSHTLTLTPSLSLFVPASDDLEKTAFKKHAHTLRLTLVHISSSSTSRVSLRNGLRTTNNLQILKHVSFVQNFAIIANFFFHNRMVQP